MKKIALAFCTISLCLSACQDGSDLLDPVTTGLTEKDVFASPQYSERFLLDVYRQIIPILAHTDFAGPRWRNLAHLEVATDNGSTIMAGSNNVRMFNSGTMTAASTNMFWYYDWVNCFAAIRAANLFLANIDNVPADPQYNFNENTRKIRKAEGKFLLAFNFAELAKQFGGLPLIKEVATPTDQSMMIPRSSFDETIAYIAQLCDEAAADLPLAHPEIEYGRATKGAALALKARMLLYAASPLWNDSANPTESPFSGKYDANKWQEAAKAAKAVIALGNYSLHPDLATVFLTRENTEVIFARMQDPMSYHSATHIPYTLYNGTGAYGVGGVNQASYNLVKEYEVLKNGVAYSIEDPASGHNPQDPFKNRDPRFYRDFIFNGAKILGKTAEFGNPEPGHNKSGAHNMGYLIDGQAYNTFMYTIKFADPTLNVTWDARNAAGGTRVNQNFPYLRYAEVLLNYAEAMNEAYGPESDALGAGKSALQALNEVRERATYPEGRPEYLGLKGGMPPVASGLSKDQMREKIKHERRVELSFEEHRFWDVRRWKDTPETEIKAQIPIYKKDGTMEYQIKTIDNRYHHERMNRMPIPQSELLANPQLVQNSGW
ncbi:RagB/SusD family nutrient uptake outer membrane protein [Ravibacter arvi]|uniref:RagB/SusD family nutrient uptake outer membrane protein n=2 Tax=Ravibacter arvi TaxID=2051041 RepID=A0ABP8LMD9_9BACT